MYYHKIVSSIGLLYSVGGSKINNPTLTSVVVITHKYRRSQQFSRVEYSTQIYRFDTRGAKEYLRVLAVELSIQPHLEIKYLQQSDQ